MIIKYFRRIRKFNSARIRGESQDTIDEMNVEMNV